MKIEKIKKYDKASLNALRFFNNFISYFFIIINKSFKIGRLN